MWHRTQKLRVGHKIRGHSNRANGRPEIWTLRWTSQTMGGIFLVFWAQDSWEPWERQELYSEESVSAQTPRHACGFEEANAWVYAYSTLLLLLLENRPRFPRLGQLLLSLQEGAKTSSKDGKGAAFRSCPVVGICFTPQVANSRPVG